MLRAQLRALKLPVVIVSTKTEQSIKGLLVDQQRDKMILRAASVAAVDQQGTVTWHPLDGDICIPMENVDYWQDGLPAEYLDSLGDREAVARRGGRA